VRWRVAVSDTRKMTNPKK